MPIANHRRRETGGMKNQVQPTETANNSKDDTTSESDLIAFLAGGDESEATEEAEETEEEPEEETETEEAEAETEEEVKANWEALKLKEGNESVLSGVPGSLPALVKAMRIQEKARGAGFDWEEKEQVWAKVEEELGEFKEVFVGKELSSGQKEEAEGELGDLIFSLVNFARFIDINPETAVERTNRKFIYRFQYLEKKAKEAGKSLSEMTLAEMDVYWEEAKKSNAGKV